MKPFPNDKNFKILNKMATKNKVTTSHAQYVFRQDNDEVRIKERDIYEEI